MSVGPALAFKFDANLHEYLIEATGEVLPHITGLLECSGLVDDRWYTEQSSDRGTAVHQLTADFDLKLIDLDSCVSRFRPYLLAHVEAMKVVKPELLQVEEPHVHRRLRFGGRPDRIVKVYGQRATWELKTGPPERSHPIQTALQAILDSDRCGLPPDSIARYCCYLKPNGKYKVERHLKVGDFDEALRIIKRFA